MFDDSDFRELLTRARVGDNTAAADLVCVIEPQIRAAVRPQLNALKLRRLLDSGDISQIVLAKFFRLASEGQFDLANSNQLSALLITMARNRLRDEVRRECADRRGGNSFTSAGSDHLLNDLSTDDPTPSQAVSDREILDIFYDRLPEDVRYLAEERAMGREWSELAAEVGGTPQSLRKKMARAIERIAQDLELV